MKILVINPGSTSTKLSIYEDDKVLYEDDIFHDAPELLKYPHVNDQIDFRKDVVLKFLNDHNLSIKDLSAIVGRGGSAYPQASGVIEIDDKLYKDTFNGAGGSEHPAKLGVLISYLLGKDNNIPCYTMDATNVDELIDVARLTGIKGLYKNAQSHVLNQKAVAKYYASTINKKYEDLNLIVCHIDGGITVNSHKNGKMIDGNVGSGGDGTFTPTRIGSIPVLNLLDYIDSHSIEEVRLACSRSGGFVSYFNTSDGNKIHDLKRAGDKKATLVWDAMVYGIIKQIGAMASVLKGNVDKIILTGGYIRFDDLVNTIKEYCGYIADIVCIKDREQETLALETYKVLKGEIKANKYTGKPVFEGFDFIDGK